MGDEQEVKSLGNFTWSQSGFLGKGSFGSVFKGINSDDNSEVAVKVLEMKLFKSEAAQKQLFEEIKVMRKLDSPHIVKLLDTEQVGDKTIIVLELCPEGDLNKLLKKKGGSLDEQTAIDAISQLLLGFKNLVESGYIHRDIKPANVLIKEGVYKISDFGFATGIDIKSQQLLKECVGTPLFMSPQLLRGEEYTAKSDIWSIGMMYYLMLFGKTPWPARDMNSFVTNIELVPLRFPYDKPISQESKDFLNECLSVEEEGRIGWDEIFNHPITKKAKGPAQNPLIGLDARAKKIIRGIQEISQIKNLDIKKKFLTLAEKQKKLDSDEFYQLLVWIDPRLNSLDTEYLFKQIDENGDNTISIDEFAKFFLEYDFSDLSDKASHIITELKEIVKANKLNLFEIFDRFDENKGGSLDLKEFSRMVRSVANGLSDQEIKVIFRKFDLNSDQNIDFKEFVKAMMYGIQANHSDFDFSGEKAKNVIEELRRLISENSLDPSVIFSKFDIDWDEFLNRREFRDLIRIIDHRLSNEEINFIFDIFDKEQLNKISLKNFENTLKQNAAPKNTSVSQAK